MGNTKDFQLDTIPTYLKDNKDKLINMNLTLDRYEISNSLTISLNRMIVGDKTKLIDIYDLMTNNFEDMSDKIKLIEEKIKYFNSQQKYEYFIDLEKILFVVFYKQIVYVKKLINDIYDYLNSNINLVYIYSYLISKLYNEPTISSNYIFIIKKIFQDTSFLSNYDDRLKKFLGPEIIDKIFNMINIIYKADDDFIKLLNELENKKMEEYKKNNLIDYSDSYKELEKEAKNIKGGENTNIYDIEINFQKTRDHMFVQKRKINIEQLYNVNNFNLIFQNGISIQLWFGYNLFIYKRFDFNFEEYKNKINELLKLKGYQQNYLLNLNYLNDIYTPDAGIIPITGGSNNIYTDEHYIKYMKYKNKYLKFKKNLKNKIN
jgi:hypothetical protein